MLSILVPFAALRRPLRPTLDPNMEMANHAEHLRLSATEYGGIAVQFAQALAGGQHSTAREMLTQQLKSEMSEERLKEKFRKLTFGGVVAQIEAMERYDHYPEKPPEDIGGVCVALHCHEQGNPLMLHNAFLMVFVKRENLRLNTGVMRNHD